MEDKKLFTKDLWLSILLILVIVLISDYTYLQGDLTTYLATPMAIADQELFTNDFSIQAFTGANPQSISDNLLALFFRMGVSWQMISNIGYLITLLIFAAGIIAIAREITGGKNYWLVSGLLMLFCIYADSGHRIGSNPIWFSSFYYAQMGFCLAVWGFYFSLKKRWYAAFSFLAVATLLHFTVGSYSAGFMVFFLLYDVFKNKNYKKLPAMFIWVLCAVGIYVMIALSGSTNTGLLSSEAFVKIHCWLRHPHHHIPSSWKPSEWMNFIAYVVGAFLFMRMALKGDEKRKPITAFFGVTTAVVVALLSINYVFVELIPVDFIGKLQPSRCVFIYRFFIAAMLSYAIYRLWSKKDYFYALIAAFFITVPGMFSMTVSGFLLFMLAIIMLVRSLAANKNNKAVIFLCSLVVIVMITFILWYTGASISAVFKMLLTICVFILIALITVYYEVTPKGQKRFMALVIALATCCFIALPWVDVRGNFERFGLKSPEDRFSLCDVDFSAKRLALRFNEKTPKDTTFLGNPYSITTSYFRLFSKRSSVIAFKNMPFTDAGMLEFVDRLMKIGALSIDEQGYYKRESKVFSKNSPKELAAYARSYGASYLLAKFNDEDQAKFLAAGYTVFDSEGKWAVYALPSQ